MKKLLASGIFGFFILISKNIDATVQEAKEFAEKFIPVLENHMLNPRNEDGNENFIISIEYQKGYIHGARDAYKNILKRINDP